MSDAKPGLTDEDFEKIDEIAEHGARPFSKSGGGRPPGKEDPLTVTPTARTRGSQDITTAMCKRWRERYGDDTYQALADEYNVTKSTVWRHVNDNCTHNRTEAIDDERCGVIRSMAADGYTFSAVARTFDFTCRRSVRDHAVGECACTTDIPPVEPRYDMNGTDP